RSSPVSATGSGTRASLDPRRLPPAAPGQATAPPRLARSTPACARAHDQPGARRGVLQSWVAAGPELTTRRRVGRLAGSARSGRLAAHAVRREQPLGCFTVLPLFPSSPRGLRPLCPRFLF